MAVVETERHGHILVVRMNRPERLNALNLEMRTRLAEAWTEFRRDDQLDVAIFTGAGRAFCAGEDMKESLARGQPGGTRPEIEDPFMNGALEKPVIAAINGFAMGGGFMLVERTDLRVAAKGAIFEVSEAKRWLLGGYNHGHIANVPYPIAMEMALGFRFTAERFHEIGFLNRLAEPDNLMGSAFAMAGRFCTMILADMGAEVVKLERPGKGDSVRAWGDGSERNAYSRYINRNKKGVTLDYKQAEGKALFLKLAADVDVLVENYRPTVMPRAGLGYEQLRQIN